jgi:hypothetical protein
MEADPDGLRRLLPDHFELATPMLAVEAVSLSGLPWLAGRGYELALVSVPVVHRDATGTQTAGRLELVTWENSPDAIMTGREELGWNKVYADTMVRREQELGTRVDYTVAWGGTTFLELNVELEPGVLDGDPNAAATLGAWRAGPLMHYRIFPRTGRPGVAAIEEVTANGGGAAPLPAMSLQRGTGRFTFTAASFECLPTLHHIVGRLAQLELGRALEAGQVINPGWNDVRDIRVIS